MKFDELRSIAHNISDSLASGDSALVHEYQLDIFGEAGRSPEGFITVDFLAGTSVGGRPSSLLARAIERLRVALVDLCRKHGTSPSLFRELSARYSIDAYGPRFLVTLTDDQG